MHEWRGAAGLAEDVSYYGKWMRAEAEKRIGYLYPKVKLPKEYGGGEATVIAWLWTRTVKCPNPARGSQMPLLSKFWLSSKKGKETWLDPVIEMGSNVVKFRVVSVEISDNLWRHVRLFVNAKGKKVKSYVSVSCLQGGRNKR